MMFFALMGILSGIALANSPGGTMPEPGVYLNSLGSPLIPLLQNVRQTLDIEIYTMGDQTVRDLIRSALARRVKVRILKDPNPVGDKCNPFAASLSTEATDCADQRKLVKEVQQAGGVYLPFDKKTLCPNGGGTRGQGCFEHGKIALADGIALVSTGNFDSTNLCIDKPSSCNRDYTLILNDPSIFDVFESIFDADLKGESYDVDSLIPASLRGILTISPDSQAPLIDFIRSATTSIDLETQYLKDAAINAALIERARAGVRVSITTASACAFGKPSNGETKSIQTIYQSFDQAGISSAMFNASNKINGKRGYLHAKVIVVDGVRAWLGSENGSQGSLTENREYGVIFGESSWVETIYSTTVSDHNSSESETWQQSLTCEKDSKH